MTMMTVNGITVEMEWDCVVDFREALELNTTPMGFFEHCKTMASKKGANIFQDSVMWDEISHDMDLLLHRGELLCDLSEKAQTLALRIAAEDYE